MTKLSRYQRGGLKWLAVLPPTLFFATANAVLASARFLYTKSVLNYRGLHVAFRASNALCRIGMTSWRRSGDNRANATCRVDDR